MKNIIIYLSLTVLAILLGLIIGKYIIPVEPVTIYIEKEVYITKYLDAPDNLNLIDYGYINPIHKDDYIAKSSPFGLREIPKGIYTGGELDREHEALDLYGVWKARIVAAKDGVIKEKWYVPDKKKGHRGHKIYGGYIVILHEDGSETSYAHLSWISSEVHEGDFVKQGDVIARQGETGLSDGPHLHFALKIRGVFVNPLKYILIGS